MADLKSILLLEQQCARFWRKVLRGGPAECWPWLAGVDRDGYGRHDIKLEGTRISAAAHRAAAALHLPDFAPHLVVRHTCDNRRCCNPAHLIMGTQADNIRDREERGRGNNEAKRAHVLRLAEFRRGIKRGDLSAAWKASKQAA
jgi:HNH endonuclease